jgi:toxin HigB-1
VRVRNIKHKGLAKFITEDNSKGVPAAAAEKLRRVLTFIQDMANASEGYSIPIWKAHPLKGGREGTWSLFVTRNWRLTFRIEDSEVRDLNLEDYH